MRKNILLPEGRLHVTIRKWSSRLPGSLPTLPAGHPYFQNFSQGKEGLKPEPQEKRTRFGSTLCTTNNNSGPNPLSYTRLCDMPKKKSRWKEVGFPGNSRLTGRFYLSRFYQFMKHCIRSNLKAHIKLETKQTVTSHRGHHKSARIARVWIEKVKQYPWQQNQNKKIQK